MNTYEKELDLACEKFRKILEKQLVRVEDMKSQGDFTDYDALDTIKIGICGGDGIGPTISAEAERVLKFILQKEEAAGRVKFTTIDGLTIENRIAVGKAIPDDVMAELKACDVILKGPTTTPQKGDGMPNIESANVAMRKALDLFANIRPVKVPEEGINWVIFRENTEGGYAVGSSGFNVTEDLAVDFTITTKPLAQIESLPALDIIALRRRREPSAAVAVSPHLERLDFPSTFEISTSISTRSSALRFTTSRSPSSAKENPEIVPLPALDPSRRNLEIAILSDVSRIAPFATETVALSRTVQGIVTEFTESE